MSESFRIRVNKTFGSISTPSPSLWSLTDDELRPNHWPRESDDPPSDDDDTDTDVDKQRLSNSLNDPSFPRNVDAYLNSPPPIPIPIPSFNPNPNPNPNTNPNPYLDSGVGGDEGASSSHLGDDELDVSRSIGLDSTLDFEEEEDEFDKVAVGKEKPDDRLYMCDVSDYVSHVESCNEVPNTFKEAPKDPRANHLAAKLRLKEDAETARDFNSLHVSEESLPVVCGSASNTHDGDINLKSILKRKDDQMDSKSEKRVRFDSSCKNNDGDEYEVSENLSSETFDKEITLHEGASSQMKQTSLVPDYIRNPSKYTHYTFDTSSDMNEASNRQAYADFLNTLKKSKQSEADEVPADLSKPVMFNPKKKAREVTVTSNTSDCTMEEPIDRRKSGVIVAIEREIDDEACEMEVDEHATSTPNSSIVKKTSRRYRSKQSLQYDESDA